MEEAGKSIGVGERIGILGIGVVGSYGGMATVAGSDRTAMGVVDNIVAGVVAESTEVGNIADMLGRKVVAHTGLERSCWSHWNMVVHGLTALWVFYWPAAACLCWETNSWVLVALTSSSTLAASCRAHMKHFA